MAIPGLPGGLIIYQGHLCAQKGHLCLHVCFSCALYPGKHGDTALGEIEVMNELTNGMADAGRSAGGFECGLGGLGRDGASKLQYGGGLITPWLWV